MTDLFNIGRSGLMAYRTALGVVGENIANVDTKGYMRRDTLLAETISGVDVADISRAFDALLVDRNRSAISALAAAEVQLTHLQDFEDRLIPGVEGVQRLLNGFFDALDGLALAPGDTGLRNVMLAASDTLAGGIADLARGLDQQARGIAAETARAVQGMDGILQALAEVQGRIATENRMGAQNPLFDQRDRLIDDLARLVSVDVSLDDRGMATIRLGTGRNGPLLLTGQEASRITAGPEGQIRITEDRAGTPVLLRTPEGGTLGGLAQAAGAVAQGIRDLDGWASKITTEVNRLHASALTPAGAAGGAVFTTSGWAQTAGALMRGNAVADITLTGGAAPAGPLTLIYAQASGQWDLRDAAGNLLTSGNPALALPGLQIALRGTPQDGDRITLTRTDGAARHMALALGSVAEIATASPLIISAAPGNQGNAAINVTPMPPMAGALPNLASLLAMGETQEFLTPGVVGMIPAGGDVTLRALPRLHTFEMAPANAATAQGLQITTPSGDVSFDWPAGTDLAQVARTLNAGGITDAGGQSLRDLGVTVLHRDGALLLVTDEGGTPPLAVTLLDQGGPVAGVQISDEAPAADMAIFTRDGRQLSGAPLSAAAAAELIRVENGFLPGAVYQPAYLDPASDFAGMQRQGAAAAGQFTLALNAAGGITTWAATDLPQETPASDWQFAGPGVQNDLRLPAGASAARQAALIGDALPFGVSAKTQVALDLPTIGTMSLRLAGDNLTPVTITADIGAGGSAALVNAINAATSSTGIRAEIAVSGGRVMLIHDQGADIGLSRLALSGGGSLGVARLGPDGALLDQAILTPDQALRISGVVTVTSASAFSAASGGTWQEAARDPFSGGLMTLMRDDAGSIATLRPVPGFPGEADTRQITLTGGDGRLHQAAITATDLDAAEITTALLADLRRNAPESRLIGAPLANPPADGAFLRVALGDQIYRIQMVDGSPRGTGPEEGRITAAFDAAGRLVISTQGGTLDGSTLQLLADAGEAARFGMAISDAPSTAITGKPIDPAQLPAAFDIRIGAETHQITVAAGGVTTSAGFPGTGAIDPVTNALVLQIDPRVGRVSIPAGDGALRAGMDTADITATRIGDDLILRSTDGRWLGIGAPSSASASSLTLNARPDLDLLVVMTGSGALRLQGAVSDAAPPQRAQDIRVLDAATGRIGLFDRDSGAFLAERMLDAAGQAHFGSFTITIGAGARSGDSYQIAPNTGLAGDNRVIAAMAGLRQRDLTTGDGGYAADFASLQHRAGAQVAATKLRVAALSAEADSAARALSNRAGVDLDAEAARMMQLQQAYQANAQSVKTARELFETLLAAL
jgi:flagellar hook-associated protein 1 FlgK